MNEEHELIQRVHAAKDDIRAADRLIYDYLPFIKAQTAKFLQRPPIEGQDEELGIGMMAFHQAIQSYSRGRGAFLPYAGLLIKSRLIDHRRREQRHGHTISLDAPIGEQETPLGETLADPQDHSEALLLRDATRQEIQELTRQMEQFGVNLRDVVDNCPRQERTLQACPQAVAYARENPQLLEDLLQSGRLPLAKLCQGSGVERKTLERHRKYLVALLLIYTNGYEIIRGHLKQMQRGGARA